MEKHIHKDIVMRLFIAEKPSLAAAIFKGLGGDPATQKKDGFYQSGSDTVTWCLGHLLTTYDPEDYNIEHKKWTLDALPITSPYPVKFKPLKKSAKQLNTVISLLDKATSIINAGDPDPEGCLLVDEILMYTQNKKPVERLLIADLNDKPVKAALANMQPNEKFQPMTHRALARTIADKAFGYNLTRAYTLKAREKGFEEVLNIGRVITTLVGLINSRTLANQNHEKSFYYELVGQFSFDGKMIKGKLIPDDSFELDDKGRMISSLEAAATKAADTKQPSSIISVNSKQEKRAAPMPFNLSKLQIEASKRWGYKPKETLDVLQGLYEKHKLITYPRSDNQFLSDAHLDHADSILTAIIGTEPELAQARQGVDMTIKHKAFNADKIEAHHAIVPTELSGQNTALNEKERRLYTLIAKRFIGLFYPESIRDKVAVDINCTGRVYRANQTTLVKQGWEVLYRGEHQDEPNASQTDLAQMQAKQSGQCDDVEVIERETQPPKYFEDASLLKAMTNAAKFVKDPTLRKQLEEKDKDTKGENGSIGTEATRSGHIEKVASLTHLVSVTKEKGYKNPVYKTTEAGQEFCALLPDEIVMPDISAIWEGTLAKIAKQDSTVEQFVEHVDHYIRQQVEHVKIKGVPISKKGAISCPTCQLGQLTKRKGKNGPFWSCNRYPDCKTTFPDDSGQPNLNPKPKQAKIAPSDTEFCKECGKPLIRRPSKKGNTFWWGCSGFPSCNMRFFDKAGKPDRDKGVLGQT